MTAVLLRATAGAARIWCSGRHGGVSRGTYASCNVGDGVWRLDANGAEVWVDIVAGGDALAFSARLGALPKRDPLPVMRFLTAANDRSLGPCRLVLRQDTIILEVIEPTPDRTSYMFRADTHDKHIRPSPSSKEYTLFCELMENNQKLGESIEHAWEEQGLPTFKQYLRKDLARRAAANHDR